MTLGSLGIQNFRALENLTLGELGRLNLLVGKNNSGKTSVLEAIRLLATAGAVTTLLELAVERDEQGIEETGTETTLIKQVVAGVFTGRQIDERHIFIGEERTENSVRINCVPYLFFSEEGPEGAIRGRRQIVSRSMVHALPSDSDESSVREGLEVRVGHREPELIRIDRVLTRAFMDSFVERKDMIGACAYVPAHPNEIDELATLWDQISLTDRESDVLRALNIIDKNIAGLTFVEANTDMDEVRRRVQRKSRQPSARTARRIPLVRLEGSNVRVPLKSMGDGLHRILDIVLRLVAIENGFLVVDEFENGLHYSVHDQLWQVVLALATDRSVQVFATTHSDDCVKAFGRIAADSKEAGVLYRIARPSQEGSPHFVKRYSEEGLLQAGEAEVEVR